MMKKNILISIIALVILIMIVILIVLLTKNGDKTTDGDQTTDEPDEPLSTRTIEDLYTYFESYKMPVDMDGVSQHFSQESPGTLTGVRRRDVQYIYENYPSIVDIKNNDYVIEFILHDRISGSNVTTGFVEKIEGMNLNSWLGSRGVYGADLRQQAAGSGIHEISHNTYTYNETDPNMPLRRARLFGNGSWYQARFYIINGGVIQLYGRRRKEGDDSEWINMSTSLDGKPMVLPNRNYTIGVWDTDHTTNTGLDASVKMIRLSRKQRLK